MTPISGSHAFAAATRGTPTTEHPRGAPHAGHTSGTLHQVPRKCPLCSSKDWANDKEVDLQKIGPQIDEVDSVLEGLIMGEYRKGRSCVDISIAQGIPYSLVFETVRRNSANINIKV